MTYKRIAQGSFKNMTPDEQRAHRTMLAKRWQAKNREKVKRDQHYYWELRKKNKPALCVCKKCGKEFNAPRNYYKYCDDCRAVASSMAVLNREKRLKQSIRVQEKRAIRAKVLDLARAGMAQKEISKITGVQQVTISKLCIRHGIRRRPKRTRRKQAA